MCEQSVYNVATETLSYIVNITVKSSYIKHTRGKESKDKKRFLLLWHDPIYVALI